MSDTDAATNPDLILLEGLDALRSAALQAVQGGHRKVYILSESLDPAIYDTDDFRDALRDLVITDRYCQAYILVKDIQPLVERGHRLLELARRLSSKVALRKLTVPPRNNDEAWMIVDTGTLLYKHDDSVYKGYLDSAAGPKCKQLTEAFMSMWEKYGEVDPSLRSQLI
jgi:hypothetical protein